MTASVVLRVETLGLQRGPLLTGLGVLAFVWGVLPALPLPPFSSHMIMHMAVVAVAAPLLAQAIAGTNLDPVVRAPDASSPIVASMVELVLVWGWHAPVFHHAARHEVWARVLEQGSFLAAGLFLWVSALGGGPSLRHRRATGGITGLLLTSMHMTLLGALITLTPRMLYPHHHHHDGASSSVLQLSPLHDQQLGGAIMLVVGGAAYLAGALWLAAQVFRSKRRLR